MEDKRFYWLKLKRDFFKRHDIQIVENMPNGKDYILFYLKMLVESVDHEGKLRFSDTIPYNEDMIATITNTNVDTVRMAMKIFTELGMIEVIDDGTIFMSEVQKMIGSASNTDGAKRQARFRERKKAEAIAISDASVTKSNADVTELVTNDNESKSKSKSKSIDIDKENVKEKNEPSPRARFVAPTHDEILDYMTSYSYEKGLSVDPVVEAEKYFNYYTNNDWRIGKGRSKMKDWRLAACNWLLNAKEYKRPDPDTNPFTDVLGGEF